MDQNREILSLTGLRFVAALYVFVFHIQIRWPITEIPFIKNVFNEGAVGMSIFFMLSGYLLMMSYAQQSNDTRTYFINRLARIYPIYFAAGLVTLPWLGANFNAALNEIIKPILQITFLLITNIFLIQAWFPQLFTHWNNSGSWSISVEAFCYAILPLIIGTINRSSCRTLIIVIASLYCLSMLPSISVELYGQYGLPVYYAMPIFRLPEFVIGSCVYALVRRHPLPRRAWMIQIAFVIALVTYLGLFGAALPIYTGHNWLVIPTVAVILCTLAAGGGPLAWLLSRPLVVWLGKISYCFYSFQALILLSLISYHSELVSALPFLANGKTLAICTLATLTVISAAAYYLIEEPSRKLIKYKFSTPKNNEGNYSVQPSPQP